MTFDNLRMKLGSSTDKIEKNNEKTDGENSSKKKASIFSEEIEFEEINEVDEDNDVDEVTQQNQGEEISLADMVKTRFNVGITLLGVFDSDKNENTDNFQFSDEKPFVLTTPSYKGSGIKEINLDNLTTSQLNRAMSEAQNQVKEKQNALLSINDDENPIMKDLQKNIQNSYKEYKTQLETLDKDLANQVDELKVGLDNKKYEINRKQTEISEKNKDIESRETDYAHVVSSIEMLEDYISQLESSSTPEQYKQYLPILKRQLETAKKAEKFAKFALEKTKIDLKVLKYEEHKLKEEQKNLQIKKDELDKEVVNKHQEVQKSLDVYNKAQEIYDNEKRNAQSIVENEITQAEFYADKVEQALLENEKEEVSNNFTSQKLPKELAQKLEAELGVNYNDKLKELCVKLNCSPEKLIQLLKMEF